MKKIETQKLFEEKYKNLNPKQKQAVDQVEGPLVVNAGPGTGKTQVLGARIANILKKTDASANEILCLTYTTAGVKAMRERLVSFIGADAFSVNIFTFHSFCNELIQKHPEKFGMRDLSPITDLEVFEILEKMIDGLDAKNPNFPRSSYSRLPVMKKLRHLFSAMKDENWSAEKVKTEAENYIKSLPDNEDFKYKRKYKEFAAGDVKINKVKEEEAKIEALIAGADLYGAYQKELDKRGKYEYADMLAWVLKAWENDEEFLQSAQEKYRYILVDEYQDTNGVQNGILTKLVEYWDAPNLFIVGDDDQSIFRFQGANIRNLLEITDKYKAISTPIVLTENYRSTPSVLAAAGSVITENKERLINKIEGLEKTLTASNVKLKTEKGDMQIVKSHNAEMEADFVAQDLLKRREKGEDLGKIAVIVRNHRHSERLVKKLETQNVAYCLKREKNALEDGFFMQILRTLQYANAESQNPAGGDGVLFAVLHSPWWGIPPIKLGEMAIIARQKRSQARKDKVQLTGLDGTLRGEMSKSEDEQISKAFMVIESLIQKAITHPAVGVLEVLFRGESDQKGFQGILPWVMKQNKASEQLQVMKAWFDVAFAGAKGKESYSLDELINHVNKKEQYELRIPLYERIKSKNGVNIITAHGSKGLEFETVYVLGCNAQNWEKSKNNRGRFSFPPTLTLAKDQHDVEEVRRLFFVAMTRAKRNLILSILQSSESERALQPSRMVVEAAESGEFEEIINENEPTPLDLLDLSPHELKPQEYMAEDLYEERLSSYSLSPSAFNAFIKCPMGWYFEQFLGVPHGVNPSMAYGQAMHFAVEMAHRQYEKSQTWPSASQTKSNFNKELEKYASLLPQNEFDFQKKKGENQAPEFVAQRQKDWSGSKFEVEKFVSYENNGIKIGGRLDKIAMKENGEIEVVDFKTGKHKREYVGGRTEKNPNGGGYFRQMAFYLYLIGNDPKYKGKVASGAFEFTEKEKGKDAYPIVPVKVSQEDLVWLKSTIAYVWGQIKSKNLGQGCGECQWCEMKNHANEAL